MTAAKRARCQHQPVGAWIRPEKRLAIYLRDGFRCGYCWADLHGVQPYEITLDHLESKSNGGHNDPANLITACKSCNSSRQDRSWKRFATVTAMHRIDRLRKRPLDVGLGRALLNGRRAA